MKRQSYFFVLITSTWKNCNVDGGGILGGEKPQKNVPKYIQVDNRLVMTYWIQLYTVYIQIILFKLN